MRRFAVLGNPIAHSKSPDIHHAFAASLSHEVEYGRILVEPGDFNAVVNEFFSAGGMGLNVTAPFKGDAFEIAEIRTDAAVDAKAANTLWRDTDGRISAHTTDGGGILRDLEHNLGWAVGARNILLLGAGGAMRGILGPLCDRNPNAIHIANRTESRASDLVASFQSRGSLSAGGLDDIPDRPWDLIINGLSSGWDGSFPDLPINEISSSTAAYDLIYSDQDTPFMAWARAKGLTRVQDGLGMLIEQAADSYEIWQGQRPETACVFELLRPGSYALDSSRN